MPSQVEEICRLILEWDRAGITEKKAAREKLYTKLRSIWPDASIEEIDNAIQVIRGRHLKELKKQEKREDTPKMPPSA